MKSYKKMYKNKGQFHNINNILYLNITILIFQLVNLGYIKVVVNKY